MRIGTFGHGWWKGACQALSHEAVALPVARDSSGNSYAADIRARIDNGRKVAEILRENPVDLLLDGGATGVGFIQGGAGEADLKLLHEVSGKVLCSHFIDPIVTVFQGLDWPVVWQCLESRSWLKAVWDRTQAVELEQFGVPNVIHLPMAAPDRQYDTRPLGQGVPRCAVSFVGAQNTSYFRTDGSVPTGSLFAGTLAQSVLRDLPHLSFLEVYHDLYGLGEPIGPGDDLEARVEKTRAYFAAKLFYNATLCIRNRDRFVLFLKRKLGDSFHLVGEGWDRAYGLATAPPYPSAEEYFQHFRDTAININLVNGNAETGLNMRHFEITAAGGFMLCYDQPELADHFEVGKECAVFRSEEDLLQKIQHYLRRPDERTAIAHAGQQRTLRENLHRHRLQTILSTLGESPGRSVPPPEQRPTGNRTDAVRRRQQVVTASAEVPGDAEALSHPHVSDRSED